MRKLLCCGSAPAIASLALCLIRPVAFGGEAGVEIIDNKDRITVKIDGELFTEYWFRGNQHPAIEKKKGSEGVSVLVTNPTRKVYYWPINGPGGLPMTRSWPMNAESEGEEKDHKHHRSLWVGHGAVNGVEFWGETDKDGRIVHDQFLELKSGQDEGHIKSTCKWVGPDNKLVCAEERLFRVYRRPANERLFDVEITIQAPGDHAVIMGDTKEGAMSIRVAESMRLKARKGFESEGKILLSTGVADENTWGKRAEWCDYSGPVRGKVVGVAMFDHPENPHHPTWWHVRDYGLMAANPFGVHDFEKQPPGTGNVTIPAGKSMTLKYRFYLHEGNALEAKVAERYKEYAAQKQ